MLDGQGSLAWYRSDLVELSRLLESGLVLVFKVELLERSNPLVAPLLAYVKVDVVLEVVTVLVKERVLAFICPELWYKLGVLLNLLVIGSVFVIYLLRHFPFVLQAESGLVPGHAVEDEVGLLFLYFLDDGLYLSRWLVLQLLYHTLNLLLQLLGPGWLLVVMDWSSEPI